MIDVQRLRDEFVRLLTEDGPTTDRRRRDYNQAIFAPEDQGGWAVFTGTDLAMVMDKFDRAAKRAAANAETDTCPGCPCGWNGAHPADPEQRAKWLRAVASPHV